MITKEQFLAGKHFTIGVSNSKGDSTYRLENSPETNSPFISKQVRSSIDGRVVTEDFHASVVAVEDDNFTGIVDVLGLAIDRIVSFRELHLVE